MPLFIPLLSYAILALYIFAHARRALTLRESLLIAATLSAAWLILSIESLSLLHAIRVWPLLAWWTAPLLILLPLLWREIRHHRPRLPRFPKLKPINYILLLIITVILAWSLCQALFSPPNNVDSNEYHLQRQLFWMQQASVENYPTSNPPQLAMPPLTEFAGLTLMVLTGNDHFHNLVQWSAFLFTLLAVSLITRRFSPSPTAQLLAALWTATIPLAFLQASTTKNDVVVMMWICLLLHWVLALNTKHRIRWPHILLLALAFGAAILTKGTGLIFALPLAALATLYLLRHHWRIAAPALATIAAIALLLNAGHFTRCYRTFGSPFPDNPGIHGPNTVGNQDHSPAAVLSNMLRAAGSHLVTPSQSWNDHITAAIQSLHQSLGRDINDAHTTWLPGGRFRPYAFAQDDEDKAAAPAHMLLFLLFPILFLIARPQLPWQPLLAILFTAVTGFILFSLLLKWQNWHVRLIITLPALLAPIFAWTFTTRRLRYAPFLAVPLLLITLLPSLNSIARPLLGPKNIFHADPLALRCYYHPNWAGDYRQLAAEIETIHPAIVGFATPLASPDYPMQRLLLDRTTSPLSFTAFNATLPIPNHPEPDPDALLVAGSNPSRLQHHSTSTWYTRRLHLGRYTLLFKETDQR